MLQLFFFFFSSRRRHTRSLGDWSSDVCSSDLRFVVGSTRVIVPALQSAVQTEPAPAATPIGPFADGCLGLHAVRRPVDPDDRMAFEARDPRRPVRVSDPIGAPGTAIRAWTRGGAAAAWTPAASVKAVQTTAAAVVRRVTTTLRDITTRLL